MSLRFRDQNPADAIEEAFFRIQREQMADIPVLNPALSVEAVDFQRWQGHWLGVLVTPWSMSVMLLPGSEEGWVSTGDNQRRFVGFPVGDFAFLGGQEPEIGEYQSCPLFSPMDRFVSQHVATMTAKASLVAMLSAPNAVKPDPAGISAPDTPSLSRRRFLALG